MFCLGRWLVITGLRFAGTSTRPQSAAHPIMLRLPRSLIQRDSCRHCFHVLVRRVSPGPNNLAPIQTFGVTTLNRFSVIPVLNQGQMQIYSVTGFEGTAEFIPF
jgi:hypothetical protein